MRRATWQTERTIRDPAEHEEAIKVRTRCRSLITGVCSTSSFGLLCPEAWEGRLADAVEEAQEMVAAFNGKAALTRISALRAGRPHRRVGQRSGARDQLRHPRVARHDGRRAAPARCKNGARGGDAGALVGGDAVGGRLRAGG